MRVVVTGASGFVGGALIISLLERGYLVSAAVRKGSSACLDSRVTKWVIDGLTGQQDWQSIVAGQQAVIHAAARVHVMNDASTDPLLEFRKINVEGSLNLARQAAAAGVKRFVFISSIKVNGEYTLPGKPYTAETVVAPTDPYGISKMEAEQGLLAIAASTGMEVVIIRPVLVYGPGVRANFLSLMKLVDRGFPLPFGAINNRRSLVSLENLVDLIMLCLEHPAAVNQIFLVSDGEDLSTATLIRKIGEALNKRALLLPVSSWILGLSAKILGRKKLVNRLCGSLEVDISKTCELLSWTPPVKLDEAMRETARHFISGQGKM